MNIKKNISIELIRRFIRPIMPNCFYRLGAKLINIAYLIFSSENQLLREYLKKPSMRSEKITLRCLQRQVVVRPNSPDIECIIQNLVRREYRFAENILEPKVIVDAGAYIGDTSLYFNKVFPQSRIFAIEPEMDNYNLSLINLSHLNTIKLIRAGLGHKKGEIDCIGEFWSASVSENRYDKYNIKERSSVPLITLDSIIEEEGVENIDILKMDIEGSETEVLNDLKASWPEKIRLILVETHGSLADRAVDDFAVRNCLEVFNYRSIRILSRV